jgi:hypothetical protein
MFNFISFVILCFLLVGRRLPRRHRVLHAWWMTGVIVADLLLIVGLVIQRNALESVKITMPIVLYVHLSFAITTVILYLLAIIVGIRLLRGYNHLGAMRGLDRVIVPCRIMTLVTSLWLQAVTETVAQL